MQLRSVLPAAPNAPHLDLSMVFHALVTGGCVSLCVSLRVLDVVVALQVWLCARAQQALVTGCCISRCAVHAVYHGVLFMLRLLRCRCGCVQQPNKPDHWVLPPGGKLPLEADLRKEVRAGVCCLSLVVCHITPLQSAYNAGA
jgi:hypothetical protein